MYPDSRLIADYWGLVQVIVVIGLPKHKARQVSSA
jgi:hypothetical protein